MAPDDRREDESRSDGEAEAPPPPREKQGGAAECERRRACGSRRETEIDEEGVGGVGEPVEGVREVAVGGAGSPRSR